MGKLIRLGLRFLGFVLLLGAFFWAKSEYKFLKEAKSAQGVVIKLIRSGGGKKLSFAPRVKFTLSDGKEIIFDSHLSSRPPAYQKGELVKVLYDPKNPQRAQIDSFMTIWMGPLILFIIGFVFFMVSFARLKVKRSFHNKLAFSDYEEDEFDSDDFDD